jgi:hypothetical protein
VPRAELACGRVGSDGDVMAAQPVRPALRLLSKRDACMAASCCTSMASGTIPPCASVVVLVPCIWAHAPVRAGFVVRGGDFSCEAETSRARRRLLMRGGDLSWGPSSGNWSEMQPIGRRLDVLPVWVLTTVSYAPCPESLPRRCRSWHSNCQWCRIILCFRVDNLAVKGCPNLGPRQ